MAIADPLSRLAGQENQLDNLDLTLMLEMLLNLNLNLKELPSSVRNALSIRVNAENRKRYDCCYAMEKALQSY
jgi:hypothetical protein